MSAPDDTSPPEQPANAGCGAVACSAWRDLAADAAIHRLMQLVEPAISFADIQRRGSMEIYAKAYLVKLDGEPVCHVAIDGSRRFTVTILQPNSVLSGTTASADPEHADQQKPERPT